MVHVKIYVGMMSGAVKIILVISSIMVLAYAYRRIYYDTWESDSFPLAAVVGLAIRIIL